MNLNDKNIDISRKLRTLHTAGYDDALHDGRRTLGLLRDSVGADAGDITRELNLVAAAAEAGVLDAIGDDQALARVRDTLQRQGLDPQGIDVAVATWSAAFSTDAPQEPSEQTFPVSEPTPSDQRSRKGWYALSATVLVLVVAIGAIVMITNSSDTTSEHSFEVQVADSGASIERAWSIDDSTLDGNLEIKNDTPATVSGLHIEVIPKEVAEAVDQIDFDPEPDEIIEADPIVSFVYELEPDESLNIQYSAPVEVPDGESAQSFLGRLATAQAAAEAAWIEAGPALGIRRPPDGEVVTDPLMVVSGFTDPNADVTLNDQTVSVQDDGSWEAEIELEEGTNEITVQATRQDGATRTRTRSVTLNSTKPKLTITTPTDGHQTTEPQLNISGFTELPEVETVTLKVAGEPVEVGPQGGWEHQVELTEGENQIAVRAQDAAGNISRRAITVVYEPPPPETTTRRPTSPQTTSSPNSPSETNPPVQTTSSTTPDTEPPPPPPPPLPTVRISGDTTALTADSGCPPYTYTASVSDAVSWEWVGYGNQNQSTLTLTFTAPGTQTISVRAYSPVGESTGSITVTVQSAVVQTGC